MLPAVDAADRLNFVASRYAARMIAPFDPEAPASYPGAIHWKGAPRFCMGLYEAATAHGMPRVHGAPLHAYLESISRTSLEALDLIQVGPGDKFDVKIVQPNFPESTFRGAVLSQRGVHSRVPVADILQTWLELRDHPVRGKEASDEIERAVISPWLLKESRNDGNR
jgi:hypothetical protein